MGIFLSKYPAIYAATFLTGKDRGGVMISEISVFGGFQHLLVQVLYILPMQHYLYPVISCHYQLYNYSIHSGQSLSATTYLKASLNWIASGLSLKPPLPRMTLNRFSAKYWLSLLIKINLKSCSAFRCSYNPSSEWMHNFHPYIQGSLILPSGLILSRNFKLSSRNSWCLGIILNECPGLCELFSDRLLNVLKRASVFNKLCSFNCIFWQLLGSN